MKLSAALVLAALVGGANCLTDYVKQNVRKNLHDHRVVSLHQDALTEELRDLLHGHDADHFGNLGEEDHVHMKLSPEAIRALEASNVDFKDTTESWIAHFEENFADPNFFCTEGTEACAGRDMQTFYQSYQTIEALHARMDSLAAASGGLATTGTIGTSFQGRNLKRIMIGDQTKPLVVYICTQHAREWLTPMYCVFMAETLLANGGHSLLNTFSFAIIGPINADGYVYSYTTDSLWRKTRKPNAGSSCVGTDPNRNWADHHCGSGASTNKCAETYCGVTPFDQPETAAVRDFAASVSNRLFSFADIHSYGGYWMSPYGWTYSTPPAADFSRMQACFTAAAAAVRAVNGQNFITGSSANAIYIAAGGSDDWFYSAHDVIYSFSVELRGNSFQPAASNIIPSNNEIFAGMVASLQCASNIEFGATPAPVPAPTTPYPTGYPTPATVDCVDLNPNGITYSDGSPAPCSEIESYCTLYDFVAERCPLTCGTCGLFSAKGFAEEKVIKGPVSSQVVYIIAPVGSALVAGMVAGLVVLRRRKQEEADSKPAAVAAPIKVAQATEAPQAVAEKPAGKDAPKDMYDV